MNEDKFREWVEKKDLQISLSNLKNRIEDLEVDLMNLRELTRTKREPNADLNEPITHKYANLCEPTRTNYTKKSEPMRTNNTEIRGLKRTPRTNKYFKDNLIKEIIFYIKQNYSTTEIKDIIMGKFGIKKTCFFKYLKLSHGYLKAIVIN